MYQPSRRAYAVGSAAMLFLATVLVAQAPPGAGSAAAPVVPAAVTASPAPAATPPDTADGTVIFDSGAYLTAPSRLPAAKIALSYLRAERDRFGLSADETRTISVTRDVVTAHDGAHHLVLGQRVAGLPVDGATITALVDRRGRLVLIGGTSGRLDTSGTTALTAGRAIRTAAKAIGVDDAALPPGSSTKSAGEHSYANSYATDLEDPTRLSARLVWHLEDDRSLRKAWRTEVEASSTTWVTSVVDATTGQVLDEESRYSHAGPEGNVITDQHPDADPTQSIEPFTGIDGSWVTGTVTSGNNVNAYRDRDNDNASDYQPSAADQHFNYTFTDAWRTTANRASTPALDADQDAAITQLFYYVNDLHDWLYDHGFNEVSGNFQVDNFGRGGAAGDAVLAESQDGYAFGCPDANPPNDEDPADRCINNANFGTGGDGSTARMQMYMWIPDRPFRDGSMDGDVIAHEYGHGVSNRLVPGGISGGINQAGSLGEGWSDTISFLRWGDATVGEYVTGNTDGGIRTEDYDEHTDTYGDYSTGVGSPHRNGEIWAATMYDVRTVLGLNDATITLILDGMRSTVSGPNATFLNARDGILAADQATTGGADRCALWSAFAGRGMGVAAVSNGLHAVPTEDFTVPPECRPTADADGPYTTDEGTDATLDGNGSDSGSDPSAGAIASYEWDLDGDTQYDDATGPSPDFTDVGQDGVFPVGLRVTDEFGNTDTATSTVTVDNVAPTVTLEPIPTIDELGTTTISGVVSDPGWEEALTASVDFGDGTGSHPLPGTLENTRPDATLTFSVPRQYGDDGSFTVTVTGADDDTSGNDSDVVGVVNLDPVAAIDGSGEQVYGGESAFVVEAGELLEVPVDATDDGSDDLTFTWDWGDGTTTQEVSLVNPPLPDPPGSPSIQPRVVTAESGHAYGEACLYELGVEVVDDDGGSASDQAAVLVTGNATVSKGQGWWKNQYRVKKSNDFTPAELQCFLDIVNHLSLVFSEHKDADSRADAERVFHSPPKSPADVIFDQHALGAWLNFANGSVGLATPVDTDGNGVPDTTFGAALLVAESVRVNPASTSAQIKAQKDIVERIATQSG